MAEFSRVFDRIFLDPFFLRKERGSVVFYPFTRLWRGYELPPHREADVRNVLRIQTVASIIVGVWLAFVVQEMVLGYTDQKWLNWLGLGFWFAFLALVMIYLRLSLVRGFAFPEPKTPERDGKSPPSTNSGKQ